jgi:6-phosphogluconolactonase
MRGEIADAVEAARIYELEVRASFAALGRDGVRFDLMLLGLGDDAHIASLFPGSPLLTEIADPEGSALRDAPPYVGRTLQGPPDQPLAAGVWAEHLHAWRITLTPAHLLDANVILMMVDGAHKADAVYAALEEPLDVVRRPAQLLRQADDRVEWLMDAPAAARLPHAPRA